MSCCKQGSLLSDLQCDFDKLHVGAVELIKYPRAFEKTYLSPVAESNALDLPGGLGTHLFGYSNTETGR